MAEGYGAQGMVGRLRRVVMRRPGEAMAAADPAAWHYTGAIDLEEARRAHDAFADALRAWDVEVLYHDEPLPDHSDSVFVFDPVLVTDRGTLVLSMGKERRRGEEEPLARTLQDCGVPVFGRLEGDARVEGGDTLWLDHDTLAVGRGFRTNAEGVRQLRGLLAPLGVTVRRLRPALLHRSGGVPAPPQPDQPGGRRPGRRLPAAHADGVLGRAQARAACGCSRCPEEEFAHTQATNVLTVAPRKLHHAGRKPGDEAAARDGRLRGRDLPRRAAVVQGGGRADLPDAAGPARPGLSDGDRARRAQSR